MTQPFDVIQLTKHEVKVDHDNHIVQIRFPKLNPNIDLPKIMLATFLSLDEPWAYDLLADLSQFDGFVPWEQLEAFADEWNARINQKDTGRAVAIVSHDSLIFERFDGYLELWPSREFKIVGSLQEGRAWLLARKFTAAAQ
jgi:hypothetical protein